MTKKEKYDMDAMDFIFIQKGTFSIGHNSNNFGLGLYYS